MPVPNVGTGIFFIMKKIIFLCLILGGCYPLTEDREEVLFEFLEPLAIGISHVNQLEYTEEMNIYTFRNFYNGAGIGVGDFNNDGYQDIFFAGNQVDNSLFLNKGDWTFLDISSISGVESKNVWTTGVSVVDINGDGWLDIYLCKSGDLKGDNRHNELFINQGITEVIDGISVVTFIEKSAEYGLNDIGLATHAAFFDYDLDGDLDIYLLNNSFRSIGNYDLRPDQRQIRDTMGGNKLLKNLSIEYPERIPRFQDVSEFAGIFGSAIGFGLGVTIGDINNDMYPDIYVSNDFFEKDYLYVNLKNGKFQESSNHLLAEMSLGSMGADMADINNDGWPDIFVTEMLPKEELRLKTKSSFENWTKYQMNIENGYHRQFSRNALQINQSGRQFSEIGRFAGVDATDWSWGALICDLDLDGYKDIYVANGIFKDILDQDYIRIYSNPEEVRKIIFDKQRGVDGLVDIIPSEPIPNVAFKNLHQLQFVDHTKSWGLHRESFSNGAVYVDLDNDGDMDLVVSNINMPPFIIKNLTREKTLSNYIKIELKDSLSLNRFAIGAKVKIFSGSVVQMAEQHPARGFMSSVDYRLNFGLGDSNKVDSVEVIWPDLKRTVLYDPVINASHLIEKNNKEAIPFQQIWEAPYIFKKSEIQGLNFNHTEIDYSDFDRDPLLSVMNSVRGPACCTGDINSDGLMDFYIGGASGQTGKLFVQQKNGTFTEQIIQKNEIAEEIDCIFFDANGDGKLDIYIVSGSSEFSSNNVHQSDKLFFQGDGDKWIESDQILPTFNFEFTSSVDTIDFNLDGFIDLIVGVHSSPSAYGIPSTTYLLENDGRGNFLEVTKKFAPELVKIGIVNQVKSGDLDGDGWPDFVVAGEWMEPLIFINQKGVFTKIALEGLFGFWSSVALNDLDGDGDLDILLGNYGENIRFRPTKDRPWYLYLNDFDGNGRIDPIYCRTTETGKIVTIAQRNDLMKQIPDLNKKFPDFRTYGLAIMEDIFPPTLLKSSLTLKINTTSSLIMENKGNLEFKPIALPQQAQWSNVNYFKVDDFNEDGIKDLILGGNHLKIKPEMGIQTANSGTVFLGDGQLNFKAVGSISELAQIKKVVKVGKQYIFIRNNDSPLVYERDN
jgi:enediyne biosynthesis protein E4